MDILASNIKDSFLPSSIPLRGQCSELIPSIQQYPLSLLLVHQLTHVLFLCIHTCTPAQLQHSSTVPLWTCPTHLSVAFVTLPPQHQMCAVPLMYSFLTLSILDASKENLHIFISVTCSSASCLSLSTSSSKPNIITCFSFSQT